MPLYTEWPKSNADLVPLPLCDRPKLHAFDFNSPQKIEFLEHLSASLHSNVFKVKIHEEEYALKLFSFPSDDDWIPDARVDYTEEVLVHLAQYSNPFYSECRAYGRLIETGNEHLAIRVHGYVLLDEAHERTLKENFYETKHHLDDKWSSRSLFVDVAGGAKLPPAHGIIKEFGQRMRDPNYIMEVEDDFADFTLANARRIWANIIDLHRLGIIRIDVGIRQLVKGKLADFSTVMTIPHYLTSPELNPHMTDEQRAAIEFETFKTTMGDFWDFENMIVAWNEKNKKRRHVSLKSFPGLPR